jgi:hypothetical protein
MESGSQKAIQMVLQRHSTGLDFGLDQILQTDFFLPEEGGELLQRKALAKIALKHFVVVVWGRGPVLQRELLLTLMGAAAAAAIGHRIGVLTSWVRGS